MRGAADRKGRGRKWIVVAGALLCGVLIAASILWYFTAYRPYDRYAEALKTLLGWQESEVSRESGSDEAGYSFTVKRPGFLHWTGNLALSAPNIRLENGSGSQMPSSSGPSPAAGPSRASSSMSMSSARTGLTASAASSTSRRRETISPGATRRKTWPTRRCWRSIGIPWRRCWTGRGRCGTCPESKTARRGKGPGRIRVSFKTVQVQ